MFAAFDIRARLRELPRLALHSLGWLVLCLALKDIVPPIWSWFALPAAFIAGYAADRPILRTWAVMVPVLVIPFAFRWGAIAAGAALEFDNGWLLTAPYWYFSAVSTALRRRSTSFRSAEALVLSGFVAAMLARDDPWGWDIAQPAMDTLRLALAAAALILAVSSLAAAQSSDNAGGSRAASSVPAKRRYGAVSRIAYFLILAAIFALLILGAMKMRRENSVSSGGGVLSSDLFRFDFGDVLSLEPEISLDAELTMLYREDGPAVTRYLRRFTLSGWDDKRGFFRDGERETDAPGIPSRPSSLPRGPETWPIGDFEARYPVRQEYYLVALDPESFFALNSPRSVEPWVIWDDASFSRAYSAESLVSDAGPWELMDAGNRGLDGDWTEYYLRGGDDETYRRMALEAIGDASGPWEQADAIESWLRADFRYSLKPGLAPDGDQLSWFLEETRRGYCSYFAFAMTRLCRSVGIPSRVAVGFLSDPESSALGFVPIRSDQAHAWVEVWLDGYGWVEFDPTSDVMAPGEEYPIRFISPDEWIPLIEEVLTRSGEVSVALPDEASPSPESLWQRVLASAGKRTEWAAALLVVLLLAAYLPRRIIPGLRRLRDSRSTDLRIRAIGDWRRFADGLVRCGLKPRPKETPLEWARRLERDGIAGFEDWTAIYLKAVFAGSFGSADLAASSRAAERSWASWSGQSWSQRLAARCGAGWRGAAPW